MCKFILYISIRHVLSYRCIFIVLIPAQCLSDSNDCPLQPPPKSRSVWRTPTPNKYEHQEHTPKHQEVTTNERSPIAKRQHEYQNSYTRTSTSNRQDYQLRGQDVSSNGRKTTGKSQHEYDDGNTYRNRATRSNFRIYDSQLSNYINMAILVSLIYVNLIGNKINQGLFLLLAMMKLMLIS